MEQNKITEHRPMLSDLEIIQTEIREILTTDKYCRTIVPECLKNALLQYPSRNGKALRPALLMWSCGIFDEDINKARHAAAGVELYHIWTLVHDDIIDNDETRRGAATVHASIRDLALTKNNGIGMDTARKFGSDIAILCGDIQQAWANHLIIQSANDGIPTDIVIGMLRRLNNYVNPGLISGEALDVEFAIRPFTDVSPDEILRMLHLKTGVLMRFAAECGAMIGLKTADSDHKNVRILGDFAEKAALAFQLKDDLLGMIGSNAKVGKPVGSDLREGKRTVLFATAVSRLADEDLKYFGRCLGNSMNTRKDVDRIGELLIECGAIAEVEDRITRLLNESKKLLDSLPNNQYCERLREWASYLGTRVY